MARPEDREVVGGAPPASRVRPVVTVRLEQTDAYLRTFAAAVLRAEGDGVVLDRSAFFAAGGGQPSDRGTLSTPDGRQWRVVGVEKGPGGDIVHRLDPADGAVPPAGAAVDGAIAWPIRHAHMRYHTALHLISGAVHRAYGSGITGGQIAPDRARMDFSLPEFSRTIAEELLREVNRIAATPLSVRVRFLPRTALAEDPTLVRVAADLLPDVDPVRIVDIGGYDVQADGETHVASTAELGPLALAAIENKGARNKRLYVTLPPEPGVGPAEPL